LASTLTLSTPWMQARLGTIVCKFGGDPAICLVEEAICAKCLQTDRRKDRRMADAARLHKLIPRNKLKNTVKRFLAILGVNLHYESPN